MSFFVILYEEVVNLNLDISSAVATQVIIMAFYIAIGFILTKIKFLSNAGTRQMSDLLIKIVTPCVIIEAFQSGFNSDTMPDFLIALALSVGFHIASILLVNLMYIKSKDRDISVIDKFTCVYSNCGFMGIPLLGAAMGPFGVFIGSAYLSVFHLFIWTHGYNSFNRGQKKLSYIKIIINPGVVGIFVSMIIMLFKIKLPYVASSVISGMATLNTPIAMILLGVYLGESKIIASLKNTNMYIVCLIRLVLLPVFAVCIFKLLNIDASIAINVVLAASCPSAAIAAIFASQSGKNSGYASSIVAVSTVFSLLTLPLMARFASIVFNKIII